ncbi:MAG TPA: HEAT repeat domain-containing protein [Acidobacteriota bacterium]
MVADQEHAPTPPDAAPPDPEGAPPPRSSGRTLVIQFFLLPALIVAACIGVFVLFGALVQERRTPREVLAEIRSGREDQRWHAAFELSKMLDDAESVRRDGGFGAELMRAFEAERDASDPRVRRFLALSLGKLGDPKPADLLARSLDDRDSDTRLYVLLALGAIGGARHARAVLPQLGSDDPGMRKAAAYVLGNLGNRSAAAALRAALHDPVLEVRWNSALALLRLKDRAGLGLGLRMLKRDYVSRAPGITANQVEQTLAAAAATLGGFGASQARPGLQELRDRDPSPAVREAAHKALERLAPAGESTVSAARRTRRRPGSARWPARPADFLT